MKVKWLKTPQIYWNTDYRDWWDFIKLHYICENNDRFADRFVDINCKCLYSVHSGWVPSPSAKSVSNWNIATLYMGIHSSLILALARTFTEFIHILFPFISLTVFPFNGSHRECGLFHDPMSTHTRFWARLLDDFICIYLSWLLFTRLICLFHSCWCCILSSASSLHRISWWFIINQRYKREHHRFEYFQFVLKIGALACFSRFPFE